MPFNHTVIPFIPCFLADYSRMMLSSCYPNRMFLFCMVQFKTGLHEPPPASSATTTPSSSQSAVCD